jgi:hypothetical protein
MQNYGTGRPKRFVRCAPNPAPTDSATVSSYEMFTAKKRQPEDFVATAGRRRLCCILVPERGVDSAELTVDGLAEKNKPDTGSWVCTFAGKLAQNHVPEAENNGLNW